MEKTSNANIRQINMANKTHIDTKHIDVLDGVRALAVFGVLWFHFWQQNWIMPYIDVPFLARLGLPTTINLLFLPRAGFLFVDWLLFLSAFCLFLPYARAALEQTALPDVKLFYQKRIARIVPSYAVCVLLIFFAVSVPSGAYRSVAEALRDLIPTLTFTQTFVPEALIGTKINGVLWTAAIEMQFYLFFPWLARAFVKKPGWTYLGMLALSLAYLWGFALRDANSIRLTVNQLPAFFGVFANGMAFAYLFTLAGKHLRRSPQLSALSLVALIACAILLVQMMKTAPDVKPVQIWQAQNRYRLSLVFAGITLSAALTFSGVRWLFSNRLMQFLSVISYNIYLWHQWIAVKLKEWRIPYWTGENPPNMTGDARWQWTYTALIFIAAFALAIAATYLVEHPAAKRILAWQPKKAPREPLITIE
ncbi:MAG: acyltransferase, partial [Eubacteriales bacterium]|nr:acyltransferase [Eubacteriales bacterium]